MPSSPRSAATRVSPETGVLFSRSILFPGGPPSSFTGTVDLQHQEKCATQATGPTRVSPPEMALLCPAGPQPSPGFAAAALGPQSRAGVSDRRGFASPSFLSSLFPSGLLGPCNLEGNAINVGPGVHAVWTELSLGARGADCPTPAAGCLVRAWVRCGRKGLADPKDVTGLPGAAVPELPGSAPLSVQPPPANGGARPLWAGSQAARTGEAKPGAAGPLPLTYHFPLPAMQENTKRPV